MTRSPHLPPLALLAIALVSACSSNSDDEYQPTPTPYLSGDTEGPLISFSPIPDGQTLNTAVQVVATLEDASGISTAMLYYRAPGTDFWGSSFFSKLEADTYTATVPATFVQEDGVDYYLKATDNSYSRNTSFSPEAGAAAPYHFDTQLISAEFPYVATFEPPDELQQDWHLNDTGWTGYVGGFDDGENWVLSNVAAYSGHYAAYHDHGSPYQTADFLDWLVSPPINLNAATHIDLYWWEWTDYGEYAQHQLLISTGNPNPANGDYITLLDPLPVTNGAEDAWAKSAHVDLSEFAGEPQVYLAFSYAGKWGDDWSVDNITLEEPKADIVLNPPAFDPDTISPGDTTAMTLTFTNQGLVSSDVLIAEIDSPDGLLTISPGSLEVGSLDAGQSGTAGPFLLTVDETHADDEFVPLEIRLHDPSSTWTQQARLQVGQPPMAHIEIFHEFQDDLQVFLGCGDPAYPSCYLTVQQDEGGDTSGTFSWDVDLSSYSEMLPPDSEQHPWFLEVWDDSIGNTGEVEVFQIQIGDTVYESEGLPQSIPDDSSSLFVYLPGRASLALQSVATTPSVLAPGTSAELALILKNTAAAPQGSITGELTALSADAHILEGGPIPFAYTATGSSDDQVHGLVTHNVPFSFEVDPAHIDSTPLTFSLILRDSINVWTFPFEVAVPYPVLGGLALTIEDTDESGNAGNSALDPDETAGIRLRIRNIGELATFDKVTGNVRLISGEGVSVDESDTILLGDPLEDEPEGASILLPGQGGKGDLIPISLTGGQAGEQVTLEITVSDSVTTYTEQKVLTIGEVPWNPINPSTDPVGDAQGYALDLADGLFRIRDGYLEMRWIAHYPFDIDETYLYSFVSGKADYQYALVLVYGEPRFYQWYTDAATGSGYWYRRYSPPSSLVAYQSDAQTVDFVIYLYDIGLSTSNLYGGASAGACNGAVACDAAPDEAVSGNGLTRFWW